MRSWLQNPPSLLLSWRRYWQNWSRQRLASHDRVRLDQRRIFILPSRSGLGFIALLMLLLLLAINFQNALIYGLCFWLATIMLLLTLHTYRGLHGLQVHTLPGQPCFAGETALFRLHLQREAKQSGCVLTLCWPGGPAISVDLLNHASQSVDLPYPAAQRGWLRPPRLTLQTTYPGGLIRAWTYLIFDWQALVYPAPLAVPPALSSDSESEHSDSQPLSAGGQDFHGLRSYQAGDSLRRIHWPAYARSGRLYSRTFSQSLRQHDWLDWQAMPGPGSEARLSQLCSEILRMEQLHQSYGLRLPNQQFAPRHGTAHQATCLKALALYGLEEPR
ncbi:DUF58 domain-containing protein [Pokkaliibacter plantistimulans]|uniref:DUF58 domain-containing protein n=1 Tax=Proteobacteria bacterium 228 TaxID=2083153 RepID=A0A2S5KIX5_9PROT|nr:DUF58 domain-containing protein [Pokkaliibacter plantistimulans]PPC74316.1 DUF58 domain-containing protein [Pokkaliibacter plantistimulans]